jgi:hypothetical protein
VAIGFLTVTPFGDPYLPQWLARDLQRKSNDLFIKGAGTPNVIAMPFMRHANVSDPNGIALNGIALFGFGTFLVEPTTQPLFQAPAGRKLPVLPTSGDYPNLAGTFARPIRWNPAEQHWISFIHLIGRASRSREQVSRSIPTFILLESLPANCGRRIVRVSTFEAIMRRHSASPATRVSLVRSEVRVLPTRQPCQMKRDSDRVQFRPRTCVSGRPVGRI